MQKWVKILYHAAKEKKKMSNLGFLYQKYVDKNINNRQFIANLNTAFVRYTLPGLGFVIPERSINRLHKKDIELAIEFASQFAIDKNTLTQLSKAQETTLSATKTTLTNKRQQKKNLGRFIEYIAKAQKVNKLPTKRKKRPPKIEDTIIDLSYIENSKLRKKKKQKIALSFEPQNYPGDIKSNKKELQRIQEEIDNLDIFLSTIQGSCHTTEGNIRMVKTLLGWLYIKEQSLTKVSLSKLVPICNIYPDSLKLNLHEYFIAKGEKEQKAKEIAKNTILFLKNFFIEYDIPKKTTKALYIAVLVNIAKYNYRNITDEDENGNYEDISVIRRLRIFRKRIPDDPPKIEVPLPKWEIVIECLEELRRRANLKRASSGTYRTKSAIATSLQRFLILGMFTIMPPSRQRVIRELRIGETFKRGKDKNGVFIPLEQLDCPEEASYYIHLQPEDYKTGDKYGEWFGRIPNEKFNDGTTFYQYLDKWIDGGFRDELLKDKTHNYLFLQDEASKPLDSSSMKSKIENIFFSLTKQRVCPHKLRTIFRTYLEDKGASQQQLKSASYWMRHDPETGQKVYTKQTLENKLKPALELIGEINGKLLNASRTSSSSP